MVGVFLDFGDVSPESHAMQTMNRLGFTGRLLSTIVVPLALSTAGAAALNAQAAVPRATEPNTIVGVVLDNNGRGLPEADVFLKQTQQRTRTRTDGTFSFIALKNGKYDVTARHLGYQSKNYRVTVGDSGGTVTIKMERVAFSLPSVVTTADRDGLSGVIADTALKAMDGVAVQILGSGRHATTDANGAFYMDVPPGQYLVSLQRKGYARQTVGVSVPEKGGRKIAAWMVPQQGDAGNREAQNLMEMSQRIMRVSPVWSKFYAREDMEKMGATDLRRVASMSAMRLLNPDCPVIVDGGPTKLPLWQLEVRDLEFAEVHTKKPARQTVTGPLGPPSVSASTTMTASSDCGVTIYAWMRH